MQQSKLIRFDDRCKFVFINTKPAIPVRGPMSSRDRELEAEKLDAAFNSVDAPIAAMKDDGICIREPWTVLEDRIVRVTRGGGVYLCMGDEGSVVAQSFDLRRVTNAAQLFFVQVSEIPGDGDHLDDARDDLRRRAMSLFNLSDARPAAQKVSYTRHDEPVRTAVVLIAKKDEEYSANPEDEEDKEQSREFFPFIFSTRVIAATFLRVVQTVMSELGVPFGEQLSPAKPSPGKEQEMTAAEAEHAETSTKQHTDTSASQLLEMLEGESDDEASTAVPDDSPEVNQNEFELGEHEARQRDATIAQNMISRVTSIQETIIGPFRLINGSSDQAKEGEGGAPAARGDSLVPDLQQPDPVGVMEALNARKPEYFNKEGMHAFMSLCNSLYRDISKERRIKAFTELVHIRTCVDALRFLRTTTTQQIAQTWERRKVFRRYQTQQYILDLQKYVGSLRESVSNEKDLLGEAGDNVVASISVRRVCANPLSSLTLAEAAALSEESQENFEGAYLNYLHEEVNLLSEQLEALRQLASQMGEAPLAAAGDSGQPNGLRSFEMRLSNVFPDTVVTRLRIHV